MIWIIGGTSDANEIAAQLAKNGYTITLSTATAYGSSLAQAQNIDVRQGRMDEQQMRENFSAYQLVIDASHPFATEVTVNALNACMETDIEYIRYERKLVLCDGTHYYPTYDTMIRSLRKTKGKIFLTIGSNNIWRFAPLKDRIVARILPAIDSLQKCFDAGIPPHQIIASKGIFSAETNHALFLDYGAMHLVCKDSGEAGGMSTKLSAAKQVGMEIHILQRPILEYPKPVRSMKSLLTKVKKLTITPTSAKN